MGRNIEIVYLLGATVCGTDGVSPHGSLAVPSLSLPPPASPVPPLVFNSLHILHQ